MSDLEAVRDAIESLVDTADDPNVALNNVQSIVSEMRPIDEFPIDDVKFVPLEKVSANSYNPNQVSDNEMELLYKSIKADGYTQPVVCVEDETHATCELTLPCGHKTTVNKSEIQDDVWRNLIASSTLLNNPSLSIQLQLSTTTDVSGTLPTEMENEAKTSDTESKSHKVSRTVAKNTASDSDENGNSETSTTKTVTFAKCTAGISLPNEKSDTCWSISCPTCASSEERQSEHWTTFETLVKKDGKELGVIVKSNFSASTPNSTLRSKLQTNSTGHLTLSEPSADTKISTQLTVDVEGVDAEIIDGFHRYITMKRHSDIRERSNGLLPITVLDKTMNEQRAATVRHNRASGKHTTSGKSQVVFEMLQDGWDDERICEELGMEPEELARLKHTSGFAKLFDDTDYSQPWKATEQLQVEKEFDEIDHPLSDESW